MCQHGPYWEWPLNFRTDRLWSVSLRDTGWDGMAITIRPSEMFVTDVTIGGNTRTYPTRNRFLLSKPIHMPEVDGKTHDTSHLKIEASNLMKETLEEKCRQLDSDSDETLKIKFDLSYQQRKEKL